MTTTPTVKTVPKATTAKATASKATTAKKTTEPATKETIRPSHTDCTHAKIGREGKAARATCRRERAAAEAKA
ncbi:hypothetical protein [Arthrobacter sp. TMN-50]